MKRNRTLLHPTTRSIAGFVLGMGLTMGAFVSQLLKVGHHPLSLQLGYRYYAVGPNGGPDWGLRFAVTLLFPKH